MGSYRYDIDDPQWPLTVKHHDVLSLEKQSTIIASFIILLVISIALFWLPNARSVALAKANSV